ncbi:helix-hairpin-helix domain-containing protein [bacterium]
MKSIDREKLSKLEDLPNVGKAIARDLKKIGIVEPAQLIGQDPIQLYGSLCEQTGMRQDPCVLDTFMSIVSFMEGGPALPWWAFTSERKKLMHLSQ